VERRPVTANVEKRCYCTDPVTKKELGKSCPLLPRSDHGFWTYRLDAPPGEGKSRYRPRVGKYATRKEAEQARVDALAGLNPAGPAPAGRDLTFGHYLDRWIESRIDLKAGTRRSYRRHIRLYLKPGLGHLKLTQLRDDHFTELYAAMRLLGRDLQGERPSFLLARLLDVRSRAPRRLNPNTIHRVHATAHKALSDAVARSSVPLRANPSEYAVLPKAKRQRALLWTGARVAAWERTGRIPSPVMVWTPEQAGAFLDFAADDRLYPLWHLVAHRGLRRGETVALGWAETDLDAGTVFICETPGADDEDGFDDDEYDETKSRTSDRLISLDQTTVTVLDTWRQRQEAERLDAGDKWTDCGRVFTHPDGRELRPDGVSQRFERLVARYTTVRREHRERGWDVDTLAKRHRMPAAAIQAALDGGPLPPIRFHDLRHNAASLLYRATRDMKAVCALLGHASIQITIDLYTTLFEEVDREAAEAAARLVPRNRPPRPVQKPHEKVDLDQFAAPSLPEPDDLDFGL
jgi:integrase